MSGRIVRPTVEENTEASVNPYAWYALAVLFAVYVVNFIDRQIIAILAEHIKADLGVDDAQLGFLYGTAFAIFYALFGLPLGRLADLWLRARLMSIGLVVWSVMTALSGMAGSFAHLAAARVGVGIGEATASPAAYSLLSDYFPSRLRATVLAIYSAGLYLGAGLSLTLGGWLVQSWDAHFAGGGAPWGFRGWQFAFIAAATPGLFLALLVARLREPGEDPLVRSPAVPLPWRAFGSELASIVPPFPLVALAGAGDRKALGSNILLLIGIAAAMGALMVLTNDILQWVALGVGIYAVGSWAAILKRSDPEAFAQTWAAPVFRTLVCAGGLITIFTYAFGFWAAPYAMRTFELSALDAGLAIGLPGAFTAMAGVTCGGFVADAARRKHPAGRLFVMAGAFAIIIPLWLVMFFSHDWPTFFYLLMTVNFLAASWTGGLAATLQDQVAPKYRATAGSLMFVGTTIIGLGLGPYLVGRLSEETGSLRTAMTWLVAALPVAILLLIIPAKAITGRAGDREHRTDMGDKA